MSEIIKISELTHFSDKQKEAWQSILNYKYSLYGGAMSGGKSYWIRWALIKLLLKWAKEGHTNVTVGLFCEDYPALKDRHIAKIDKEFPSWLGTFHADHKSYGKSFILKAEYGSGVIAFRNLDDPSKYQSSEFACIAVDEITKNPLETFEDLRTRLRWSGIKDVKFICATNPGGIGHAWVKMKWLDKNDETEVELEEFNYTKALATDNPYIDAGYLKSLESLPEDKKRAFLEGDWDIFKGQYFSEWRKEIHTVEPFDLGFALKRFICLDYGYSKPSAALWCAMDSEGDLYVYRELYETNLTYEGLSQAIVESTLPNEEISYIVADPAIWAKKDSPVSGADRFIAKWKEITGKTPNLLRANNDRVVGWNEVREFLKPIVKDSKIVAKLRVFKTCEQLIRTLPSLIYDKFKVEDLDSDGDDHLADALRYGVMSRPKKPQGQGNPLANMLNGSYSTRNKPITNTSYE